MLFLLHFQKYCLFESCSLGCKDSTGIGSAYFVLIKEQGDDVGL